MYLKLKDARTCTQPMHSHEPRRHSALASPATARHRKVPLGRLTAVTMPLAIPLQALIEIRLQQTLSDKP
jgi:hypothetical protein